MSYTRHTNVWLDKKVFDDSKHNTSVDISVKIIYLFFFSKSYLLTKVLSFNNCLFVLQAQLIFLQNVCLKNLFITASPAPLHSLNITQR